MGGYIDIMLMKNRNWVVYSWDRGTNGYPIYLYSGVTLQLEVGDVVNLRVPAYRRLYDDGVSRYSTGFLIFSR